MILTELPQMSLQYRQPSIRWNDVQSLSPLPSQQGSSTLMCPHDLTDCRLALTRLIQEEMAEGMLWWIKSKHRALFRNILALWRHSHLVTSCPGPVGSYISADLLLCHLKESCRTPECCSCTLSQLEGRPRAQTRHYLFCPFTTVSSTFFCIC